MSTWPDWLPIRKDIANLSPYGAPQIRDVVALNTNENPFSIPEEISSEILKALPTVIENLNRYPDRDAINLRKLLSEYVNDSNQFKFEYENIWAANGSNEIIQTLFLTFGSEGAIGFIPSYSMHQLIAQICGVKWISGSRGPDFELNLDNAKSLITENKPSLIFVTTPNNPTGNSIKYSELSELARIAKSVKALLIIDEAYAEFSSEKSGLALISEFPNVVIVRTMSKAFALAGARLGYLVADKDLVKALLLTRLPYHLSAPTQAIAAVALKNRVALQKEVELLKNERERVRESLIKWGFKVVSSDSNFLLFSGFRGSSEEVWRGLLDKNVLIRDVGIPNHLRVTIGTPDENNQFLAAISSYKQ